MKKQVRHYKRWLALCLAVVVVAAACIWTPDHFLRATDGGTEEAAEENGPDIVEEELVLSNDAEIPDGGSDDPAEATDPSGESTEAPEEESGDPAEEAGEGTEVSDGGSDNTVEETGEKTEAPEEGTDSPVEEAGKKTEALEEGSDSPAEEAREKTEAPEEGSDSPAEEAGENTEAPEEEPDDPAKGTAVPGEEKTDIEDGEAADPADEAAASLTDESDEAFSHMLANLEDETDGKGNEKVYRVTYEGNGGVDKVQETSYEDSNRYSENARVYASENQFIKENAEFAGWKMLDDTTGELIGAGQAFVMPDHDITLVAQWKEKGLSLFKAVAAAAEDGTPRIYTAGDTIEFLIQVSNTGDVDLEKIVVTDTLENAVLKEGEGYTLHDDGTAVVESLAAGETVTVKAAYEVAEKDIGRNDFVNHAKAVTGTLKAEDTTDSIPMEGVDRQLTVVKKIANSGTGENGAFTTGDTARFEITVTNTGNQMLNDIVVEDSLADAVIMTGDGYDMDVEGNAVIRSLAQDDSVTVTAEYVIRESDLGNEDFRNVATATVLGDDGAVSVTGTGTSEPVPVEDKVSDFSITKTIDDEKEEYTTGDIIHYTIKMTNTGNMELDHIVVTDILSIEGRQVSFDSDRIPEGVTIDGNRATIDKLPVHAEVLLNCSYEVTREDIISASPLYNSAIATGLSGADGPVLGPRGASTSEVKLPDVYHLTIHYVDANMTTLAPDIDEKYLAGETFSYISPTIEGYTPNYAFVRTEATGMPRADVEVFVIYTANPGPVPAVPPVPGETPAGGNGGTAPSGGTTTGGNGGTPSSGGTTTGGNGGTSSSGSATTGGNGTASSGSTTTGGAGTTASASSGTQASASATDTGAETPEETMSQGAAITTDEDGNIRIVPVTDPEVPLAGSIEAPDIYRYCISHFVLLLLSMIIFALYINDRRKCRAQISSLTEKLELEKQKRMHKGKE